MLRQVLLPVGLGTGLALMGDASLYAVLPTHAADAGISLASVGLILSVNRFIRVILNGPVGLAYDRWPHRPLFVAALVIGACSTAVYALAEGFWLLLAGRLLWGLAWAGIWVGGHSIILAVSGDAARGRAVGFYQIAFYLGASGGAMAGGLMTDLWGYHRAMGLGAGLTLLGAVPAMLGLPETSRATRAAAVGQGPGEPPAPPSGRKGREFLSAVALMAVNRLVLAGVLMSTFGLALKQGFGDAVRVGELSLGVATLTGLGLGLSHWVSMVSAPVMGGLSDQVGSRWKIVVLGLAPGVAGFVLLASGSTPGLVLGLCLAAFSGGSNQGLSTALVGDLSVGRRYGRGLAILFTAGDLASAIGPLLAYALIPWLGVSGLYLLCAGQFALMFLVALGWAGNRFRSRA